jgi:hypothetical protein
MKPSLRDHVCASADRALQMPEKLGAPRTDPLPRSAIGKILKADLRAPHWEGRERRV